ncbi:uncharacterized protein LOC121291735 isoform X1 [Carcharodon carcharias]|uniref:uncharacterized protein LOC121291735 isoform X1 n=1 Tax=Carcharodon carcharias TaxID=13397 RepID=UPI001B7E6EEF|nr:uncharacterized protein LOC121291735 isoform X1 [Carcharodon carcharias]
MSEPGLWQRLRLRLRRWRARGRARARARSQSHSCSLSGIRTRDLTHLPVRTNVRGPGELEPLSGSKAAKSPLPRNLGFDCDVCSCREVKPLPGISWLTFSDNEERGAVASLFMDSSFLEQWTQPHNAVKQNLSACFNSVDIEALVLELQPGILLFPTICTEAQCQQNKSWLHELDDYCKNLVCSAERNMEALVNVAKAVIRTSYYWDISNLRSSPRLSSTRSNVWNLYTSLLKLAPEQGKVLQESVAAAEELDVTKVDLEVLARLLSIYPPWEPHAVQHLTTPSEFFYTNVIGIAQSTSICYQREFLHAVLLSTKTKKDQMETFYTFRGDEILLPTSIDSMWVKTVKSMRFLLLKHVFEQEKQLHRVMWFSPTEIKQFLKELAAYGYPHITRELEKCMNSRNIIRFKDGKPLKKKMCKELVGGPYVNIADTSAESCPPKIQLHTKHWLPSSDCEYQNDLFFTFNFGNLSSSDPWLFRMAGALASEWKAVARDFGFSGADIKKIALDPWYNHQHRMFHFLKSLMGEQSVKFTELCFLLLCKGKEYKCYRYLQDIIGTALPDVNCSPVLSSQYIEQLHVGKTESLAAFYKKGQPCPIIKETSGKEFENFLHVFSLLGPVYDVHTPVKGTEVLLYLPSDASAEESLSASFLGEILHALSAVMSLNSFAAQLCNFLSEPKKKMLYKFLTREEYDSFEDLMFTDTTHEAMIFRWVKRSSSIVRTWPRMYRHLLELSPVRVGHIKDENLELLVPLAATETHAVVLVNSCSPFVTLEKLLRNVTSHKAYFLLYKPVGRSYVDFRLTLKVILVPRRRSLLQELDKILKDHKRMLKKQVGVHRTSWYKLQINEVKAVGTSLSISPEEAEQFQFVDNAEEILTCYEIKFNMGKWETWPLVLELVEDEKNIKIQERLWKGMLNAENGDYLYIRVNAMKRCVTRIHNEFTYRELREAVEKMFPNGNFILTHKQHDSPLLIDGDLSLQSILQEEGSITLEANYTGGLTSQNILLKEGSFTQEANVSLPLWSQHFIEKHEAELIERLTEIDSILNGLKTKCAINQYDVSKVRAPSTIEDQVRELMTCVIKKGNNTMDYCHDLLRKYHRHLVSELEKREAAE